MDGKIIKIVAGIMLAVMIISGLAIWLYYRTPWREVVNQDDKTTNQEQNNSNMQNNNLTEFTLEEIATHNNPNDCFVIVDSTVYDVSDLIRDYPEETDLIPYCGSGEEARSYFEANPNMNSLLENYFIGELSWAYTPDYADGEITIEEVAMHNTPQDCYIAVSGKVYDVTKYINSHPGGNEILRGCGKDATNLFVGKPHSDSAVNILKSYYIGDLAN
jgi:cytochrome b involved in lipid metabolism